MIVLISILVTVFLVSVGVIIRDSLKEDEREIYNTRCVILYNRRTRKIKEMLEKDYIENPTWEEIGVTYSSICDGFYRYLRDKGILNKRGEYIGKSSSGAFWLKSELKKYEST